MLADGGQSEIHQGLPGASGHLQEPLGMFPVNLRAGDCSLGLEPQAVDRPAVLGGRSHGGHALVHIGRVGPPVAGPGGPAALEPAGVGDDRLHAQGPQGTDQADLVLRVALVQPAPAAAVREAGVGIQGRQRRFSLPGRNIVFHEQAAELGIALQPSPRQDKSRIRCVRTRSPGWSLKWVVSWPAITRRLPAFWQHTSAWRRSPDQPTAATARAGRVDAEVGEIAAVAVAVEACHRLAGPGAHLDFPHPVVGHVVPAAVGAVKGETIPAGQRIAQRHVQCLEVLDHRRVGRSHVAQPQEPVHGGEIEQSGLLAIGLASRSADRSRWSSSASGRHRGVSVRRSFDQPGIRSLLARPP